MDKSLQTKSSIAAEREDILGPNFRALTLNLKASQVCTLVHYPALEKDDIDPIGILYVHGYTDYFYQTELAEFFHQLGFDFYAVDLHGYGRSIRPYQADHNQNHFSNYFADLDVCLSTMAEKGIKRCILLGHSTGGLVTTRYLTTEYQAETANIEIIGHILNSPFLSLPLSIQQETWRLPLYRLISQALSGLSIPAKKHTLYARSIHRSLEGEWSYRLDWKPSQGSALSFSWLHQIIQQQAACLTQECPIPTLLCRSSQSTYHKDSLAEIIQGDAVLDVDNMESKAKRIFTQLDIAIIDKGYHDLILSPSKVRKDFYKNLQSWLSAYQNTSKVLG